MSLAIHILPCCKTFNGGYKDHGHIETGPWNVCSKDGGDNKAGLILLAVKVHSR